MNVSDPAAKVYAEALIQLAQDERELGAIYEDLAAVRHLYADDPYFHAFFSSPRLDREVKWPAIRAAFEGKVGRPVLGLLSVLIVKGRETLLDNIVDQFVSFKDLKEHRVHALVRVAAPLSQAFREELVRRLEAVSGEHIELHEEVDPSLIGGAALRIGDKVIDRTVRKRLTALREHLSRAGKAR